MRSVVGTVARVGMHGTLVLLLWQPGVCGADAEDSPGPAVRWAATLSPTAATRDGGATVEVSAQIKDGWHVYAATQAPGGPTPLRLTLDNANVATVVGRLTGTAPQKKHDPSFDLDTLYFTHSLQLHVPVHLVARVAAPRVIPLSIRFQTCSDRECQPPTTVHLDVPIDVRP